jgi:hypothetical protein
VEYDESAGPNVPGKLAQHVSCVSLKKQYVPTDDSIEGFLEAHRGRIAFTKRYVHRSLQPSLPCITPSLFVQYYDVVDALALGVHAGLRGGHRLAIGRHGNSRGNRWLAIYLAYDLERSVVNTLEGVCRIRCLSAFDRIILAVQPCDRLGVGWFVFRIRCVDSGLDAAR